MRKQSLLTAKSSLVASRHPSQSNSVLKYRKHQPEKPTKKRFVVLIGPTWSVPLINAHIAPCGLEYCIVISGTFSQTQKVLICDNGGELTSKAMFFWSLRSGTKLHFIQPGKPMQNAFVESFNGTFRDSCLNEHWFRRFDDARQIINKWRHHYYHVGPHSSLGYVTPMECAKRAA